MTILLLTKRPPLTPSAAMCLPALSMPRRTRQAAAGLLLVCEVTGDAATTCDDSRIPTGSVQLTQPKRMPKQQEYPRIYVCACIYIYMYTHLYMCICICVHVLMTHTHTLSFPKKLKNKATYINIYIYTHIYI